MNLNTHDLPQDHCSVLFRLKQGSPDAGRFVYALACFVERWRDVEVVNLKVSPARWNKTLI